ncbi:MAG: GNAT family N-acetyltransferase [Fuerstiella sp.]|nr:GNAT family N-acetyltransferase [Fuerstiella sp.]MCP4505559.1 GNAT family N-acetyltransferase [Fuerstiella sp.]
MTTYRTLPANQVTAEQWAAWSLIQAENAKIDSPFFSPEFTRTVGTVRRDVEVAIVEDAGRPVAFFPFQRNGHTAQAIAGRLSEFHGAILDEDTECSARDLLHSAGIKSWHFDHLPESQTEFGRFSWGSKPSPFIDLMQGYDTYRAAVKTSGSSVSQAERKARKMAREIGPLRFEWHDSDSGAFESLVDWKSAQHRRTRVLEIFKHAWVSDMLAALMAVDSPGFSAPLATLYAGNELVALHLGICSRDVLHLWFPAYNCEYEKYSPGVILLLRLAEAAANRGIARIDMGPGEERYKQNFKSGDSPVYEGLISQSPVTSAARGIWYHTKRGIRQSRFRTQLEAPLIATRRLRQWLAFQQ